MIPRWRSNPGHVLRLTCVAVAGLSSLTMTGCATGPSDEPTLATEGSAGEAAAPQALAAVAEQAPAPGDDLRRFVAAAETALAEADADGAGAVLDDPAVYIAIGQVSCARFSAGDSLEQIVADHPADDDVLLGAVLGAAVETMCPEHAAKL